MPRKWHAYRTHLFPCTHRTWWTGARLRLSAVPTQWTVLMQAELGRVLYPVFLHTYLDVWTGSPFWPLPAVVTP